MTRDAGDNSGGIGSQSGGASSGGGISVDSGSGGTRSIPAPRWLGKRVGRFKLLALLGQGAMGRVFRAEDTLMGRHVALKLLPKSYKKGGVSVGPEMLINEARAAAAIEHPSAVQIYEVNQAGDVCYVAMELLEGGSLRDLVRAAGPMDVTRACLLCAEAAEALAAAHAAGVVHRDVKPANLMLSRQGRCKVVDFGLARLDGPGDWGSAAESVGTPQFIAPEILSGTPASAQSDIYSLGGTLWYLLTGKPPYQGKDAQELLRMHVDSPVPDIRSVRPEAPAGLANALETALAKRPADRFATMEQLARVLRVHAIPIAGSAENLDIPVATGVPPSPQLQRPARPATPLHQSVAAPPEEEPEPDARTVYTALPHQQPDRMGWPLLVGGGVVIAAIVAVLCIVFLRPSKDGSVASPTNSSLIPPISTHAPPMPLKPAGPAAPEVLPPSLVAQWVADDYESGSNWVDRIHHLTAVQHNAPASMSNAFNGHAGVHFDGKKQYFLLNGSDDPVPDARAMTLVAVFKPNAAQKVGKNFWQGGGLIGADMPKFADDFGLAWGGDSGLAVVGGAGNFPHGQDGNVPSPDLELNRAHVAVMTWDCPAASRELATIKLYVDGTMVGQKSAIAESRLRDIPIALGAASASGSMSFSGLLAEIQIYSDSNLDVSTLTESLLRTYVNEKDRPSGNPLDPNGLLGH
jgi:serine/threonine protein kinase